MPFSHFVLKNSFISSPAIHRRSDVGLPVADVILRLKTLPNKWVVRVFACAAAVACNARFDVGANDFVLAIGNQTYG